MEALERTLLEWPYLEGIPLVVADGAMDGLVAVSAGTVGVEQSPELRKVFEAGAIIPALPWSASPDAIQAGTGARPLEIDGTVTCLELPSTLWAPLNEYAEAHVGGKLAGGSSPSLSTVCDPLGAWLHSVARFSGVVPNGIAVRQRSTAPMTVNTKTGLRVGLHVDSWDGLPLRERKRGRLRLCVNVGVTNRFFLFVPIAVSSIASSHEYLGEETRLSAGATDVAQAFLRLRTEIPVVRVMIKPGWAYIGPTENVVHDACAEEEGGRDMSLHATVSL